MQCAHRVFPFQRQANETSFHKSLFKEQEVRLGERLEQYNIVKTQIPVFLNKKYKRVGETELKLRQIDSAAAQLNSDAEPAAVCERLSGKERAVSGGKTGRC